MTVGMRRDKQQRLLSTSGVALIAGVLALATYWGWIFSTYSSAVLNPFEGKSIFEYLLLLVISVGASVIGMLITALFPDPLERFLRGARGAALLAILACLGCIPALLDRLGIDIVFAQAVVPWFVSSFISSLVFLKTGAFFVWLKRAKLSRCIALSFLLAALLYMVALLLDPLWGVIFIMILPPISCICTLIANRHMRGTEKQDRDDKGTRSTATVTTADQQTSSFFSRLAELKRFVPLTLIYTISFGLVSYVVLYLATTHNLVIVIALSILVSSLFAAAGSFLFKVRFEAERVRHYLLPLIAIALLPFPYLSPVMKIVFLSVAVFGFTCFDAISWGDLADEVRDRTLKPFRHLSAATTINFTGIFIGWGSGYFLFTLMGAEGYEIGFGVISIVLIILLVLNLVSSNVQERESGGVTKTTEFRDTWEKRCIELAQNYRLTKQEERVFLLLARGRSYGHIAEELTISIHTVKTHIYHIYQKLAIHSQQELIDMVEATL